MKQMEAEFIDISRTAQEIEEAVRTRHSVREYQDRPIPESELEAVFGGALRAPSWKNAQPWKLHVVSGGSRDRMAAALTEAARSQTPQPETPWLEKYPADKKRHIFALGMQLYGIAGIDRKDKEARDEFMLRNFNFFGAPSAAFITTTCELNFFVGIDIGCLLQTILLLARGRGLATCPQAALGAFPSIVKDELGLGADEKVIMGLSIGYAKDDAPVNRFHTHREDSLVSFYQ